jgi:serine/threonine protein kinase
MNSATLIRSYSSKKLEISDERNVTMPDLRLEDLDLGEILGSGTTGTVKLAVHVPTGIKCAVKIIAKRKFFFNKKLEETTAREVQILDQMMQMNHPNVVKCYGHIDEPSYIYIVMEVCEGGELLEQLEHLGKYTEEDTSEVSRPAAPRAAPWIS